MTKRVRAEEQQKQATESTAAMEIDNQGDDKTEGEDKGEHAQKKPDGIKTGNPMENIEKLLAMDPDDLSREQNIGRQP